MIGVVLLIHVIVVIIANSGDVVRPPTLRLRLAAVWAGHRLGRFRLFRRNDLWRYNRSDTRYLVVEVALLLGFPCRFDE